MNPNLFKELLVVLVLVLVLSGLAPGASAQAPTNSGEPGPSAVGVRVNPHQLPTTDGGPQPVREVPRLYPVDDATFGLMKTQANAAAAAQGHLPGAGTAQGTAPKPNFDTIGFTGWNPPDGALAAGPTSLLVAVNEAFAFYDKSSPNSLLLGPISFQNFFGMSGSIFDPRALYDAGSSRFVLLAATMNSPSRTAFYTLAVSSDASAGSWCTYKLNAVTGSGGSSAWADFPGLGMDGVNLYITSNQFAFGGNRYQTARILVVPKSSVYPTGAGCPTATSTDFRNLKNPDGSIAFTVQPANQPDALPGQTGMYFVNAIWASGSRLAVRSVTTSGTSLTLSAPSWVNVFSYNLPADAPQPGGKAIDSGDTRLGAGAIHRFGNIYTANTTGKANTFTLNAYANAQWYAFAPGDATAASAVVTDLNVAYYYPGVVPGCATISTPCLTNFVGIQVSGSGALQPASAYSLRDGGTPTIYATGFAGYTLNGRWGDYSAASADPSDVTKVWVFGEYAKAPNAWGTAVTTVAP